MKRLRNAHYYHETLVFIKKRFVIYILVIGVLDLGVSCVTSHIVVEDCSATHK